MKGLVLLFACLLRSYRAQLFTECPLEVLIHPCQCNSQVLNCSNAQSAEQLITSFTTGFQETADFVELAIIGSSITYLPAEVFRPIRAHKFTIMTNANLSYVDENAFAGSEDFIRSLHFYGNNIQGVDIFLAMAKMKGLKYVQLRGNSLSSVPERAFATMPELSFVDLSHNRISSLGREAFADCPKLSGVLFYNNELRVLPGRILASDGVTVGIGDSVVFYLYENQIEKIEPDAFDGIEKRVDFIFRGNRLKTISRETFQPLLDRQLANWEDNFHNSIVFTANPFVCDCRMRWIVGNQNYFKIMKGIICVDTNRPLESYSWRELGHCVP